MAEVTGQIGNEAVSLDNAATEATLKLLLQATLATTKEQKAAIANLAKNSGLDPAKVEAANTGLVQTASLSEKFGGALGGLTAASNTLQQKFLAIADFTEKLTSGKAEASDLFGAMSKLPFGIGLVATGFQKLAQFQEANLKTYQELSASGINFSGSLTNMRLSASGMYLSMDQFGKLMKENSQTFAKLGGTANDGAEAFVKVSKSLLSSKAGDELRALGYTSEQVNQGLATYLEQTGGRSKEEMANTKAITASAKEYLTQLDELAEVTGKSKEEQIQAGKEAAANQAWQAHLMTLTEEQKAKAEIARANALAQGGKGAEQALMSAAMGFPPMTKAAREYAGIASNMNQETLKQAKGIKDANVSLDDMKRSQGNYNLAAIEDKKRLGTAGQALIMQGGNMSQTVGTMIGTANRAQQQGLTTQEAIDKQHEEIAARQAAREVSEADTAAKTQKSMQELGQEILKILLPAFNALQPILLKVVTMFADVAKYLAESPNLLKALGYAAAGLTAIFVALKVKAGIDAVGGLLGGGKSKGGVADALGGGGGGRGGKGKGGVAGALTGGGGPGDMIGGVADGLGKIGPMLSSLGKGAGEMFSGIMQGIAGGLRAFANPQILLGAGIFAGAIAIIGAGIAAAAWILGKALPTLAEGLEKFNDLDGTNLIAVGGGMVALGAGLGVFGAGGVMSSVGGVVSGLAESFGSLFGAKSPVEKLKEFAALGPGLEQAGTGIQALSTSLDTLLSTDLSRIKELSAALIELKEASKQPEKSITGAIGGFISSKLGGSDSPAAAAGGPAGTGGASETSEILKREMQQLNKQTIELVKAMKEAAENTKRTASLIASNGNIFKAG
jgi:hypothetical protein